MADVGIIGHGGYVPLRRYEVKFLARRRNKKLVDYYVKGLWCEEKAVPGLDEDATTLGYEAARNALRRAGINAKELGAVYLGSESQPYAVGSSALQIASFLGTRDMHVSDLELACNSGMEALNLCDALVKSGKIDYGLAIGADFSQGAEGDPLEILTGAGAGAFIVGSSDPIAEILDSVPCSSFTLDFWRRDGQPTPTHHGKTTKRVYMMHVLGACTKFLEKHKLSLNQFDWITAHSPYAKLVEQTFRPVSVIKTFLDPSELTEKLKMEMKENPERVVKRAESFRYINENVKKFVLRSLEHLTLSEEERREKIHPTLLSKRVANSYAGNTPLNLVYILEMAKPRENILAISYGSGAASLATWIKTLPGIRKRNRIGPKVGDYLNRSKMLGWRDFCGIKIRRVKEFLGRRPKRVVGKIEPIGNDSFEVQLCHGCRRVYFPPHDFCLDERCRGFNKPAMLEQIFLPKRGELKWFKKGSRKNTYEIFLEDKVIITDTYPPFLKKGVELEAIIRKVDEEGDGGPIMYAPAYRVPVNIR
jgi:hydroxymethylglutaryl-CoA synthase